MEGGDRFVVPWASVEGTGLILVGIAALLIVTTLARGIRWVRQSPEARERDGLASIGSWWVLFGILVGVVSLGPPAVVVMMALMSLLLLWETLRLARQSSWLPLAAIAASVVFLLLWHGDTGFLVREFPLAAGALLVGETAWRRRDSRAPSLVNRDGVVSASLMGIVGPLYAAGVALFPAPSTGGDPGLGWFVLLVVLTAVNDSAQAWWGRTFGAHRMTPTLSPKKTWEGLAGGVLTTSIVALVIAPVVTLYGRELPLGGAAAGPPLLWCLGLAVVLSMGGLAGDLLASRMKRRAGAKDSGRMIPGQGGLLDRIDSLTVTAPAFYLTTFVLWLG